MRFIARFAMLGPYHAAGCAALIQIAAQAVGFLLVFSGAVIALVTLRKGSRQGLKIMIVATALAVFMRFFMSGHTMPMLVLCLVVWLPAWLLAGNLARTQQQAYPLIMIAILVAAYAAAMRTAIGDMSQFWEQRLMTFFDQLTRSGGAQVAADDISLLASQMHIGTLVGIFCLLAATIFLARWWQSSLYNPGGFGSEFRALRLPRWLMPVALIAALLSVVQSTTTLNFKVADDAFVIVVVLFAFQGLAVIHARLRSRGLGGGWLVGLYTSLVFVPQLVGPVLATTGVADGVADFRRLSRAEKTHGESHEED